MSSEAKLVKATSPGVRGLVRFKCDGLWRGRPVKQLVCAAPASAGRNNLGRITVRHRGGGAKRAYRLIDFKGLTRSEAQVVRLEHDPNRTARIALLRSKLGDLRYVLAVDGLRVGDWVRSQGLKRGDVAALADVPAGAKVCNVEVRVGAGGSVARAAGCFCQVQAKLAEGVVLKLASGQRKLFDGRCLATVGAVSNRTHALAKLGKAGRARWLGRRPEVRGVAMNPVDHPHGGGEGKTSGGRQPVSPWGWYTKGRKTRRRDRSDKLIVPYRKTR